MVRRARGKRGTYLTLAIPRRFASCVWRALFPSETIGNPAGSTRACLGERVLRRMDCGDIYSGGARHTGTSSRQLALCGDGFLSCSIGLIAQLVRAYG